MAALSPKVQGWHKPLLPLSLQRTLISATTNSNNSNSSSSSNRDGEDGCHQPRPSESSVLLLGNDQGSESYRAGQSGGHRRHPSQVQRQLWKAVKRHTKNKFPPAHAVTIDDVHETLMRLQRRKEAHNAEKFIAFAKQLGYPLDVMAYSRAIHTCASRHKVEGVQRLIDDMRVMGLPVPSHSHVALHECFVHHGMEEDAVEQFNLVLQHGAASARTLAELVTHYVATGAPFEGIMGKVNAYMGAGSHLVVAEEFYAAVLNSLARLRRGEEVDRFIGEFYHILPSENVLKAKFLVACMNGSEAKALRLLEAMLTEGCSVDASTLITLSHVYPPDSVAPKIATVADHLRLNAMGDILSAVVQRIIVQSSSRKHLEVSSDDAEPAAERVGGTRPGLLRPRARVGGKKGKKPMNAAAAAERLGIDQTVADLMALTASVFDATARGTQLQFEKGLLNIAHYLSSVGRFRDLDHLLSRAVDNDVCVEPLARVILSLCRNTSSFQLANRALALLKARDKALGTHYQAVLSCARLSCRTESVKKLEKYLRKTNQLSNSDDLSILDFYVRQGLFAEALRVILLESPPVASTRAKISRCTRLLLSVADPSWTPPDGSAAWSGALSAADGGGEAGIVTESTGTGSAGNHVLAQEQEQEQEQEHFPCSDGIAACVHIFETLLLVPESEKLHTMSLSLSVPERRQQSRGLGKSATAKDQLCHDIRQMLVAIPLFLSASARRLEERACSMSGTHEGRSEGSGLARVLHTAKSMALALEVRGILSRVEAAQLVVGCTIKAHNALCDPAPAAAARRWAARVLPMQPGWAEVAPLPELMAVLGPPVGGRQGNRPASLSPSSSPSPSTPPSQKSDADADATELVLTSAHWVSKVVESQKKLRREK